MRLLFLGSGDFGLPTLKWMHAHHEVAAVISQPDRPAGRARKLTPTPIANWAQDQGLRVLKTENVNTPEFIEQVRGLGVEASVVVAFGQKLSEPFIEALGQLAVNLHASLLPKYRGAAPINWAMMNGERETGVSVIGLAQKMDAGQVYGKERLAIDPMETAGELHDRLAALGPGAIGRVLDALATERLEGQSQNEAEATLAPKLRKSDGTVNFEESAERVRAQIHGLTPWPGCRVHWTSKETGKPEVLTLRRAEAVERRQAEKDDEAFVPGALLPGLLVATRQGALRLLEVQPAGKQAMTFEAFARGRPVRVGDVLYPLEGDG